MSPQPCREHEVRLFGAFDVRCGESSISPTAPKQAQLLSLMLLHADAKVSRETIAEELWSDDPPATYRAAIHTYVMQLRRMLCLEHLGAFSITRLGSRYGITVHGVEVDLHRYLDCHSQAQRCLASGDRSGFIEHGRAALAAWSADLLADVRQGPVVSRHLRELAARQRALRWDLAIALVRQDLLAEGLSLLDESSISDGIELDDRPLRFYCLARLGRRAEALRLYEALSPRSGAATNLRWLTDAHADLVGRDRIIQPYDAYTSPAR